MNDMDDRPPGGLKWWDAVRAFSDPERLRAYNEARRAIPGKRLNIKTFEMEDVGDALRDGGRAKHRAEVAFSGLKADFHNLLQAGDVVAIGHPDSAGNPLQAVPAGEWEWLGSEPSGDPFGDETTFSDGARAWHRVLFYGRTDVEAWERARAAVVTPLVEGDHPPAVGAPKKKPGRPSILSEAELAELDRAILETAQRHLVDGMSREELRRLLIEEHPDWGLFHPKGADQSARYVRERISQIRVAIERESGRKMRDANVEKVFF